MKRLRDVQCNWSITVLFVLALTVLSAHAQDDCPDPKTPFAGHFAGSQVDLVSGVAPRDEATGNQQPVTVLALVDIDECGNWSGSGLINTPVVGHCADPDVPCPNPVELTFDGVITRAPDGIALPVGRARVTVTADFGVGQATVVRECLAMREKDQCVQEFHCVNGTKGPTGAALEVLLLKLMRTKAGTCQ